MIKNLSSLFMFMINSLLLLLLILPERLLAETVSYASEGADWTGTCSSGQQQSPIDIDTVSGTCDTSMVMDLTFSSGTQNITMYDDGNTFKGNWTNSSLYATDINGLLTGYQSAQFHFHSPSEHRIGGETYDLELHIVHKITDQFASKGLQTRPYAVVSILFQVDNTASANAFLTALNLASNLGKAASIDMKTTLLSNLASPLTYYTYQGSLTTPACNETVNWYVVETPMKMTSSQLTVFTSRFSGNSSFAGGYGNNREVQSLNGRVVKQGGAECEEQFVYFFSFVILFAAVNYFVFKLL